MDILLVRSPISIQPLLRSPPPCSSINQLQFALAAGIASGIAAAIIILLTVTVLIVVLVLV